MAKFSGKIGYGISKESEDQPGVWIDEIVEKPIIGELMRNSRVIESTNEVNDGININNQISFIADPFSIKFFQFIRYVELRGIKWKAKSVEVLYPKLIVVLGGVYHGE